MSEPTILIESISPQGNLQATVEDDGATVYFYLSAAPDLNRPLQACWVANRTAAPESLDRHAMVSGHAPLNPIPFCVDPQPHPGFQPEDLEIIWMEEGNGAALFERETLLAVIPGWAGDGGFSGYALGADDEGPLAWPLQADNAMHQRIAHSRRFWALWEQSDTWDTIQHDLQCSIEDQIGPTKRYFAIDGGHWPPCFLVAVETPNSLVLCTGGMSIRPQPDAERYLPDEHGLRIELALALDPIVHPEPWMHQLSALAAVPWSRLTWLGDGHTVEGEVALGFAALLLHREPPAGLQWAPAAYDGEPVVALWCTPITRSELDHAQEHGSDSLKALLGDHLGHVRTRDPVV